MNGRGRRIFGILALAAGIVLIMLEVGSWRQGGEISWFWIVVAGFAMVLGIYDIIAARRDRGVGASSTRKPE